MLLESVAVEAEVHVHKEVKGSVPTKVPYLTCKLRDRSRLILLTILVQFRTTGCAWVWSYLGTVAT